MCSLDVATFLELSQIENHVISLLMYACEAELFRGQLCGCLLCRVFLREAEGLRPEKGTHLHVRSACAGRLAENKLKLFRLFYYSSFRMGCNDVRSSKWVLGIGVHCQE
jgi:hypothetical protein